MSLEYTFNRFRSALIYAETSLDLLANAAERLAAAPDAQKLRELAMRARTIRTNVLLLSEIKGVVPYETVSSEPPMVLDPDESGKRSEA